MFKEILKEEAGIADSVNTMLEKIKFIISNDYKQNGVLNYTLIMNHIVMYIIIRKLLFLKTHQ